MVDPGNKMLSNCKLFILRCLLWKKNYSKDKYDQTWNVI